MAEVEQTATTSSIFTVAAIMGLTPPAPRSLALLDAVGIVFAPEMRTLLAASD